MLRKISRNSFVYPSFLKGIYEKMYILDVSISCQNQEVNGYELKNCQKLLLSRLFLRVVTPHLERNYTFIFLV